MGWISSALQVGMLLSLLAGCASSPPQSPTNICGIFAEKPSWHKAALAARKKWGMPVEMGMAFVFRESAYLAKAKPPRGKLLWVIPWRRPSSAYGYAQATDPAWKEYLDDTRGWFRDRDDFSDAIDFIGWYNHRSRQRLGIARTDAYHLYIAYYAGMGGYANGSWRNQASVKRYADKVARLTSTYAGQIVGCPNRPRWRPW